MSGTIDSVALAGLSRKALLARLAFMHSSDDFRCNEDKQKERHYKKLIAGCIRFGERQAFYNEMLEEVSRHHGVRFKRGQRLNSDDIGRFPDCNEPTSAKVGWAREHYLSLYLSTWGFENDHVTKSRLTALFGKRPRQRWGGIDTNRVAFYNGGHVVWVSVGTSGDEDDLQLLLRRVPGSGISVALKTSEDFYTALATAEWQDLPGGVKTVDYPARLVDEISALVSEVSTDSNAVAAARRGLACGHASVASLIRSMSEWRPSPSELLVTAERTGAESIVAKATKCARLSDLASECAEMVKENCGSDG